MQEEADNLIMQTRSDRLTKADKKMSRTGQAVLDKFHKCSQPSEEAIVTQAQSGADELNESLSGSRCC